VAGELDAYLTFGEGSYGKNARPINIEGETTDTFETQFKSVQIKRYDLGFQHDRKATEEWKPGEGDSVPHDPTFEPVTITKVVDVSTPSLLVALYVGAVFDNVWIWQKKAGASKERTGDYFFKIELLDANITSLSWSASDGGPPEETLKLEYRGISLEYVPQQKTGALDQKAAKTTSNPLGGDDPDFLTLPTAKNRKDKNGSAMSTSDKNDIVKEVLAMLKKHNQGLKIG
jgi:type VI secretion system Hcp family effector